MKIIRSIAMFLIMIALILTPFEEAQAISSKEIVTRTKYHSYKDIPGVTKEEIASIEKVLAEKESFTFGSSYSVGAFYIEDEEIGGFYSLLCERLSFLFGIPFQVDIFAPDEIDSKLEDKEIDFTGEVLSAHLRDSGIITADMGINRTVLTYEMTEHVTQNQIGAKRFSKVGYLKGSLVKDMLQKADSELELVEVQNAAQVMSMLENEEIDAFCDWDFSRISYGRDVDVVSDEFLPLSVSPMYISTNNEAYEAIISVIDKYVQSGGNYEIRDLVQKGEVAYKRNNFYMHLSKKQRTYLEERLDTPIPFVASYDNYPICFYNEAQGEYQGISIDVLKEISQLTGLTFVPSNQVGQSWKEILEELERGESAFATELIYTAERSKFFMWPETAYSTDNYVLISRVDQADITVGQIPLYRIGVIAGTGYTTEFDKWFPEIASRTEFETYVDAFDSLGKGEVDFVMGTQNLLINNANYLEKTGFRANVIFDYYYESAFGFHPSQKELCDIFSKVQPLIKTGDITQSWTLRGYDYQGQIEAAREKTKNTYFIIGVGVFLVIAFFIAILLIKRRRTMEKQNRILEETVRLRTAELEQQTKAAQEASKAKSDFLARMSHEIRTPLNAIIGLSRIAKQAAEPESKTYVSITDALAAENHLLGILNDVLDMTKIEAGKLVLEETPFLLREAMQEPVNIYKEGCEAKSIQFVHNIDQLPNVCVKGDKMRLNQVLINLLSNAVKFSLEEGTVQFKMDCKVQEASGNVQLSFVVKDDGIGISDEQLLKIYDTFEQADSSIATNFGGVGLGLSISQNLIHMMGGSIVVESAIGQGSSFSFDLSLPLVEKMKEEMVEDSFIDLSGRRVIIVDDVAINRVILSECLSETNVDVDEAENGQVAFETFSRSPQNYYDVIFMDIQMPVLNGYEATEKIRALDREDAKQIPIIAVTANAFQDDIDRGVQAGINRHLAKPINIQQLMQTLQEIFP